jgi:hypothetical protein
VKTKIDHDTVEEKAPTNQTQNVELPGDTPPTPEENRRRINEEIRKSEFFGELIFAYTRAEAIKDGVLVDVSKLAQEAGFRYPVAMTAAVWETCVRVPGDIPGRDESGRIWDLINVLRWLKLRVEVREQEFEFTLAIPQSSGTIEDVFLKSLCHLGDAGEPVVTIALRHED